MSTGQQCDLIEVRPGEWYVELEDMSFWGEEEEGRGDGEMIRVSGPHPTEEAAIAHLLRRHANPGGWSTYPFDLQHQAAR